MKTLLISMFSGVLILGVAAAQDGTTPSTSAPSEPQTSAPQAPTQPTAPESTLPKTQSPQAGSSPSAAGAPTRIAPGSVIPVELTKTVDAKKAKAGDEVVAKVTQDMKSNSGEVLVPKDTKMVGHVTEAQAHSKEQKESEIGIAFDHAVMKDGGEMQLPMSIQAIIGPQNNGPQNNGQNSQNGGGASSEAVPSNGAGGYSPTARTGAMGASAPPTAPPAPVAGNTTPSNGQTGGTARPPITAKTEGVVGISDLKLTAVPPQADQGSVVSSEKNNVKLESGTLMLLRVNQQ